MSASLPSNVDELLASVSALSSKLAGREGNRIREALQRLAAVLADTGPEPELRERAAVELEQLIAAIVRLTGMGGPTAKALRGFNLRKLADGLRTFVEYLRAPTADNQAQVEQLVARMQGSTEQQPVPLDAARIDERSESGGRGPAGLAGGEGARPLLIDERSESGGRGPAGLAGGEGARPLLIDERSESGQGAVPLSIDRRVESLAIQAAMRRGLHGDDARRAVERMKREMAQLVSRLELRAREEAERARAASEMERLLDQLIGSGNQLGQAIAPQRAAIAGAFRRVDLAHMSDGMRAFAVWISTPTDDAAAHVATLMATLGDAVGPPTAGDPLASEAERRAEFEREIAAAVEQIFSGARG